MREFDNSQSWLDLDGQPLVGRLTFYKLHTSEKANIYNVEGNVIANPVFTNQIGQTQYQVFLDNDVDYTVVYEKYIGQGDMSDDDEQENWLFQYSNDCTSIKINLEVESDAIQSVNCIADLRNLDPDTVATRNGNKYIELLGYNNPCDKPLVYYKWNPTSIASDNGGSVIKVADISTGRWELIDLFTMDSGVDVRHFGVFPAASRSSATDAMSTMIYQANTYAASKGKPLYFPYLNGYGYYKTNNLTISFGVFESGTYLFGNTGTTTNVGIRNRDTYLRVYADSTYNATFTITGDTVRTSYAQYAQSNTTITPNIKLIYDMHFNTSVVWNGIIVDMMYADSGLKMNNCVINSVGKLGNNCQFSGKMNLAEIMFQNGVNFSTITVDNDVNIDIGSFSSVKNWLALKSQQSGRILDLQGKTLDSSCVIPNSWVSVTFYNAIYSDFKIPTSISKHYNCSGTIQITYANNHKFELHESILTLTNYNSFDNLSMYNSELKNSSGKTAMSAFALNLNYSTFSDFGTVTASSASMRETTFKSILTCASPTLINCEMVKALNVKNSFTFQGTTFHAAINHVSDSASIVFYIIDCLFADNGQHKLSSSVAGSTITRGVWQGNKNITSTHFIALTRTNLDSSETQHHYVYEGNTGKNTLQWLAAKWTDTNTVGSTPIAAKKIIYSYNTYTGKVDYEYPGMMNQVAGGTTNENYYLTECKFFSVGTRHIGTLAFKGLSYATVGSAPLQYRTVLTANEAPLDETQKLWYSDNVGWPYNIVWRSGYTWRICATNGPFMSAEGNVNILPSTINVAYEIKSSIYIQ